MLTARHKFFIEMLRKGYGMSAAKGEWIAADWRVMEELVEQGWVRKRPPSAWNKAGAFVISEDVMWTTLKD